MNNKSCGNPERPVPATDADTVNDTVNARQGPARGTLLVLLCVMAWALPAAAGGGWRCALVDARPGQRAGVSLRRKDGRHPAVFGDQCDRPFHRQDQDAG